MTFFGAYLERRETSDRESFNWNGDNENEFRGRKGGHADPR